jgi:hypothetical protein
MDVKNTFLHKDLKEKELDDNSLLYDYLLFTWCL